MVDKIEVQLSDVQVKIGDKLHFLDKDMDGILSREEMAECLQQVLKREITIEEAMFIAGEMVSASRTKGIGDLPIWYLHTFLRNQTW